MRRAWRMGAALAAVALLGGCAGGSAQQRPDQVTERTVEGNLEFVDTRSLMVSDGENPDQPARLLSRGESVSVVQDGQEVGWDQLAEGDQVRVVYTERISGPSEIDRVEILSAGGGMQDGMQDGMPDEVVPPDTMGPQVPGEPGGPVEVPDAQTPEPLPGSPR